MSAEPEVHTDSIEELDFEIPCAGVELGKCDSAANWSYGWHGHKPEFICDKHHAMTVERYNASNGRCGNCGHTYLTFEKFVEPVRLT